MNTIITIVVVLFVIGAIFGKSESGQPSKASKTFVDDPSMPTDNRITAILDGWAARNNLVVYHLPQGHIIAARYRGDQTVFLVDPTDRMQDVLWGPDSYDLRRNPKFNQATIGVRLHYDNAFANVAVDRLASFLGSLSVQSPSVTSIRAAERVVKRLK